MVISVRFIVCWLILVEDRLLSYGNSTFLAQNFGAGRLHFFLRVFMGKSSADEAIFMELGRKFVREFVPKFGGLREFISLFGSVGLFVLMFGSFGESCAEISGEFLVRSGSSFVTVGSVVSFSACTRLGGVAVVG